MNHVAGRKSVCWAGSVLWVVAAGAWGQAASDSIDLGASEREMIAALTDHGVSTTVGRAVVHLPVDAMSSDDARALATRLNQGIEALAAFMHSPHIWQRTPARIDYYFHPSRFISFADPEPARVFIALPRLLRGGAPLLHETAHVLLYPRPELVDARMRDRFDEDAEAPGWLFEGVATYLGMSVSKASGLPEGDPMGVGSIDQIDARCAAALGTPVAAEVLPFIGIAGAPDALLSVQRRAEVGPAFYGCSASFNKFVAGRIGVDALIDLMPTADTQAALEGRAGKTVEALRAEWRREIGAGP